MRLLDLLQIADSAFPTGAYAHSVGLEGLYGISDVDLETHVRFLLDNSMARIELPVLRFAHAGDDAHALDELMDVLLPVKEFRDASRSLGRSFRRALRAMDQVPLHGEHHAVVYGTVLREWQLDVEDGARAYAFGAVRQQLSAAQRMGKIGQSAVQSMLHRVKPYVEEVVSSSASVTREGAGGFAPLLDLAGMLHAHQSARLFLS